MRYVGLKEKFIIKILLTLLISVGCLSCEPAYHYQIPEQIEDGWNTASVEDVGIQKKKLGDLVKHIRRNKYRNIHSLVIIKDGKLVFEEYFDGHQWNPEYDQFKGNYTEFGLHTKHNTMSVAKAFTSALVGIAIDQGFIESVDEKLFSFFPEHAPLIDQRKNKLTHTAEVST